MKKKIAVVVRPFGLIKSSIPKIKKKFLVKIYKNKETPNQNNLIRHLKDCEGVIAGDEIYNKDVLDNLPNIKVISRAGIGIDNIDLDYCKKKNITVLNTPDAPSKSAAEFAFTLILNSIKKISILNENVKKKKWIRMPHDEFSDLIIGIIGYGRIGKRVAKLLLNTGFKKILINDISKDQTKSISSKKLKVVSKNEIFKYSDVISFHVPLTNKTINLFDKKKMRITKKNACIINTSRGKIINFKDLEFFLKKRHFSSISLDVAPIEPYKGKLLKFKNCTFTPHNGSMSFNSRNKMENGSIDNLINFFENEL